jgi:general secretion pathway protein F
MSTFIIKYRSKGKITSAKLTAENLEAAKRLSSRFGAVLSIKREQDFGRKVKGMTSADRFTFLVRLSTMLGSRMATADALRLLRDSFQGPISDAAARLLDRLNVGTDLPSAIVEEKIHFPGSVGLIIKVGAKSGHIYTALKDAAEFEQRMANLKSSKGRSIATSVFGFVLAAVLVVVSVFWIGPEVMKIGLIQDNKSKVDVGWVNDIAEGVAIFIGVGGGLMAGLLWLATMGRAMFPQWADGIIMKIPYYKDIVMAQDNYLVLRRLSLMIGTGVRVEEALASALEAAKPGLLKKNISDALQNLRMGKKWSEAFSTLHPTDRAALALAADRTQIAENLNMIANQAQDIYLQRIESFAPIMQVASALAMTLAGMVLFGQTMLPTLQVAAKMLN